MDYIIPIPPKRQLDQKHPTTCCVQFSCQDCQLDQNPTDFGSNPGPFGSEGWRVGGKFPSIASPEVLCSI